MQAMHSIIDNTPNISVISKIEILRFKTTPNSYKILDDFVNESVILNLDYPIVQTTIAVCRYHKIKLPDAVIAATAIVNDFILVTRNKSDFKNIDGLMLINPWELSSGQFL